jgi:NADH:ubiquinone oxidoreductase subunit 3 (subunit A)
MNATLLLRPPVAFSLFLLLLALVYRFFQRHAAKGPDHAEKYLPYSSGQNLPPTEVRLSYQEFFRLGLLFGVVHVATLVLSLLPLQMEPYKIGIFYLLGISISAYVLVRSHSKGNRS